MIFNIKTNYHILVEYRFNGIQLQAKYDSLNYINIDDSLMGFENKVKNCKDIKELKKLFNEIYKNI